VKASTSACYVASCAWSGPGLNEAREVRIPEALVDHFFFLFRLGAPTVQNRKATDGRGMEGGVEVVSWNLVTCGVASKLRSETAWPS
jgi:hypothetical protein